MKKRFETRIEWKRRRQEPGISVRVHIPHEMHREFALLLAMLRYEVIEALVVDVPLQTEREPIEFRIESAPDIVVSTFRQERGRVLVWLSVRDCEAWLAFLLRYCRDGVAVVDHLDLEIAERQHRRAAGVGSKLCVTLQFEAARPPVPSDEARKLLGLD